MEYSVNKKLTRNVNILTGNLLDSPGMSPKQKPSKRERSERDIDLADFIRETLNRKNLTAQDVENRSNKRITRGYISRLMSRTDRNPTLDALNALADGMGIPRLEVYKIAAGDGPMKEAEYRESALYMLFERRSSATPEEQQAFDLLLEMLLGHFEKKKNAS
jgi:transcriptional regulator with XRE-family HTH domain